MRRRWGGFWAGLLALLAVPMAVGEPARGQGLQPAPEDRGTTLVPPLRPLTATDQVQVWSSLPWPLDRQPLLQAIDHSLTYLASPKAAADYQDYRLPEISRDRVWRSLQRLRHLVATSPSQTAFQAALAAEFELYQATGNDEQGTVAFTGYFEPHFRASPVPTAEYRYPLYLSLIHI